MGSAGAIAAIEAAVVAGGAVRGGGECWVLRRRRARGSGAGLQWRGGCSGWGGVGVAEREGWVALRCREVVRWRGRRQVQPGSAHLGRLLPRKVVGAEAGRRRRQQRGGGG